MDCDMDDVITQVQRPPPSSGEQTESLSSREAAPSTTNSSDHQQQHSATPPLKSKSPSRWKSIWKSLCSCCSTPTPNNASNVDRSSLEDLQDPYSTHHHGANTSDKEYSPSPPPVGEFLLDPAPRESICLVIDLDETLVHSSFKPIPHADFVVPVEIDGVVHQVYVAKRPYVDEFLEKMGGLYECVLFTASLAKYADPVADLLDHWGVFKSRLFRESCVFHRGNYVKDLARLGRDLGRVVIVDNSPASYIFHPDNAVPVCSWFDDASDTELLYLIPFFQRLASVQNVYTVLRNSNHPFNRELKMAANNSSLNSSQNSGAGSSSMVQDKSQDRAANNNGGGGGAGS